jgi:hypothetical protein
VATSLAVMVPSASALVDFPHEQTASKWRGILALDYEGGITKSLACDNGAPGGADCSFKAATSGKMTSFGIQVNCADQWEGDLGYKGEVSGWNGCVLGNATGQICQHALTREYWVRWTNGTGVVFGHLLTDPSGLSSSSPTHFIRSGSFGHPAEGTFTGDISGNGRFYRFGTAEMWSANEVLVGAGSSEDGNAVCGWPELA